MLFRKSPRLVHFSIALTALLWSAAAGAAQSVTVAVVSDGPSERFYVPLEILRKETTALLGREFEASFPPAKRRHGDWGMASITAVLQELLNDPEVDVILTSGLIATHIAAHLPNLDKPVIGIAVADAALQKFPQVNGASGKHNFVYLADDRTVAADLDLFHRLIGFKHLAILADRAIFAALPELPTLAAGAQERLNTEITLVEVSDSAEQALATMPNAVDAVFIPPLLRFSGGELERLAALLVQNRLPSFALVSQPYLEYGMLMTGAGRSVDVDRAARRIALNLQAILLGQNAGELKVALTQPQKLAINMATARQLGWSPRWQDLEGALVIDERAHEQAGGLSMVGAIERALAQNLSLKVAEFAPLIAANSVRSARAGLLPQLGAKAAATVIDDDRANAVIQSERSAQGSVQASQLLYSEQVWSGYHIAQYLRDAEDAALRARILDTIQSAASAYLALLQANAQAEVRYSNVTVTEKNLELAQGRARVGQSGKTDVLRFTSELAIDRQNYYAAQASADAAKVELKRVLNMSQSDPLRADDSGIPGLIDLLGDQRFLRFFDNQASWDVFRAYAVGQAITNAPELDQNEALLARASRSLKATERAYYVPDVSVVGQSRRNLLRGGRGASLRGTGLDDDEWSVGLEASLPLFRGGARDADRTQARYELSRTQIQRAEIENDIRARVLVALERAGGSFPAIRLSRQAAAAAADNLAVVTDAYSAGAASITELNDAQDAALTARLSAAQARYQFMRDLIDVQRGMADFDVVLLSDGVESWYRQIDDFFRTQGDEKK